MQIFLIKIIKVLGIIFVLGVLCFFLAFILSRMGYYDSKITGARFDIKYIQEALERYYGEHGRYPTSQEGLILLTEKNQKGDHILFVYALTPGETHTTTFPQESTIVRVMIYGHTVLIMLREVKTTTLILQIGKPEANLRS